MSKNEELTGIFSHERNVFQDNMPDRTVVAVLDNGAVVKGRAQRGQLKAGFTYRFLGHWTVHDRHGKQFLFSSFAVAEPLEERGILLYLQKAPKIGPQRACLAFGLWGRDAVKTLRERPEEVAEKIPGMSLEQAKEAAAFLILNKRDEALTIELTNLLGNRGFPRDFVDTVKRKWGENGPTWIKDNPYILMTLPRVGFSKADRLYLELGKPSVSIERQARCLQYALSSNREGHTWMPKGECEAEVRRYIAGANVQIEEALRYAEGNGWVCERFHKGASFLSSKFRADGESWLASYVACALSEVDDHLGFPNYGLLKWPSPESLDGLTRHQREQYYQATRGRVGMLTGSPGTGKTTVLAAIIKAIYELPGRGQIGICAPTGKASVRISEALARNGLEAREARATTIHGLLIVEREEDGGWKFKYGKGCKLPHQFVFVDEDSMIDMELMRSLLSSRPRGCHMLFVGDPHQLPPVGHGAPIRDLIAAGIPCGHLTEIHRNAGQIVKCCKSIREKQQFEPSDRLDPENGSNLVISQANTSEQQIEAIARHIEEAAKEGIDPVWDVQVICPLNKVGPVSRESLNKRLQEMLNPCKSKPEKRETGFRLNDKVVCTKNCWLTAGPGCPRNVLDDTGRTYVANGEQARITNVAERHFVAELDLPRRVVMIPKFQRDSDDSPVHDDKSKQSDEERDWELAYAISCHRSQGSEWPVVIVVIDESGGARWLCTREWITTAISRAKKYCICVGKRSSIQAFCKRTSLWNRRTFLREKIADLQAPVECNERVSEPEMVKLPTRQERVSMHGRCIRCGRRLTTPESIELGIGPECAKIMGLVLAE